MNEKAQANLIVELINNNTWRISTYPRADGQSDVTLDVYGSLELVQECRNILGIGSVGNQRSRGDYEWRLRNEKLDDFLPIFRNVLEGYDPHRRIRWVDMAISMRKKLCENNPH